VAVSIDGTNSSMTLYVDGVAVENSTSSGPIEYAAFPNTYIGRSGDGITGFDFDGRIDEARIHNRALSAQEIAALAVDPLEINDNVDIIINAVNDAPEFVKPELISNGDLNTDLSGWTTTGTVDQTAGSLRFGGGDAVGPHTGLIVCPLHVFVYCRFEYCDGDFHRYFRYRWCGQRHQFG